MKKILGFMVLLSIICSVNAQTEIATRACAEVDLCTWDNPLPLGSENCCGCGLTYMTYWPLNTDTSATCTFDGSGYADHDLYISIDNDIIDCTLNGNTIVNAVGHEGCAPADPRSGYGFDINPTAGTNTLTCHVRDRGSMSHFNACVVGSEPVTSVPEFASMGVAAAILLTSSGFAYMMTRKKK
jgi:hypothetical protein